MTRSITGRIGLIGNPVEHSLSPVFQQAAFDALNIPVTYELWQTTAEEIRNASSQSAPARSTEPTSPSRTRRPLPPPSTAPATSPAEPARSIR
ncbi:MAG: hypothetical protein R2849_21405 [Thermomicrobiales bacterium]